MDMPPCGRQQPNSNGMSEIYGSAERSMPGPAVRSRLRKLPDAFPAAPRGAGAELCVAAAVDDVGAGEVAKGGGEHVDKSAEGPEGEQYPGRQCVQPESDRGLEDQVGVRV